MTYNYIPYSEVYVTTSIKPDKTLYKGGHLDVIIEDELYDNCNAISFVKNDSDDPRFLNLSKLPKNLTHLFITHMNIYELPKLPDTLLEFYCVGINIVKVPIIPQNLIKLTYEDNRATSCINIPEKLLSEGTIKIKDNHIIDINKDIDDINGIL